MPNPPLLGDLLAELQASMEGADAGLRLVSAFLRISDPALRAAAIDFVSKLAEQDEQASKDQSLAQPDDNP